MIFLFYFKEISKIFKICVLDIFGNKYLFFVEKIIFRIFLDSIFKLENRYIKICNCEKEKKIVIINFIFSKILNALKKYLNFIKYLR